MSALPPKADKDRHVRFVPKSGLMHRSKMALLFDHLVGEHERSPIMPFPVTFSGLVPLYYLRTRP